MLWEKYRAENDTRSWVSSAGLLISNIDIDSIDDTFGVSISVSTILLGQVIKSGIEDTFKAVFADILISILLS